MIGSPIPVLDLSPEIEALWEELNGALQRVLRSGQFIMGDDVRAFEEEIAAYLGVEHAIGVNSGTDALLLSLLALGIGVGDEVITTPFTFFATAEAISQAGATPRFVDIDPATFNLDLSQVEAALSPRTRALLPVHLFGHAADMGPLLALAEQHGLHIVEDAAQACGGRWHDKQLGTLGDAGAFSFFPSKNLGAFGDAGLVATKSAQVAEQVRMLRAHGGRRKYHNEVLGYNSRLDSLQAAILRVKLPYLDGWNEGRRQVAARYQELLEGVPGLTLPQSAPYATHVYHQFTVRVPAAKRDALKAALQARGVATMIYYPVPVHQLPVYVGLGYQLPMAEQAAAEVLSLPIWPTMDEATQRQVATLLKEELAAERAAPQ